MKVKWAGHVVHTAEMENSYIIIMGKRKIQLGRPRHRSEDNTKMVIKKQYWVVDRIHLLQYRDQWWDLENMVMNFHKR
jgi:hypothetical protein